MPQIDLQQYLVDSDSLPRATTLFREAGLRALLLHLEPGEGIPEHRTPGPISVHCISGEGTFVSDGDSIALRPGVLISLAGSVAHSVAAGEQKHLVLIVHVSEQHAAAQ
ncbi:MAG TPA: cupin domain-containing protein [Bryobacteraceae bacterium]|jgi:quercetin dioxygenase-like cupin family protein|nr:cupin domain-containing protein [Bryobacteraceae bacterium]